MEAEAVGVVGAREGADHRVAEAASLEVVEVLVEVGVVGVGDFHLELSQTVSVFLRSL